jgi:plastocyanin
MPTRAHLPSTLAFALLAVAAAACGGVSDAGEPGSAAELESADVVITAEDVAYVDPPQEIDAGTVTIGLDNQGRAPHDVTFEGAVGTVVTADGGSQATGEATLEPGTYTVYCAVSGHREAGMEFEVVVR